MISAGSNTPRVIRVRRQTVIGTSRERSSNNSRSKTHALRRSVSTIGAFARDVYALPNGETALVTTHQRVSHVAQTEPVSNPPATVVSV